VDQRRFIVFLILTLILWTGFIAVRIFFAQPQVIQNPNVAQGQPAQGAAAQPDKPADQGDAAKAEPAKPAPARPGRPRKRVWIGSLDKSSSYNMAVLFDSQGAAVELVELARYSDVADLSGYFGDLALADNPGGGVIVNAVAPGSPASSAKPDDPSLSAGLKAGDVITGIGKLTVASQADFEGYFNRHVHPSEQVSVTVQRAGVAKPIVFTATLVRRPLAVVRPENHRFKTDAGELLQLDYDPLSLLLTLESVGSRSVRSGAKEIGGLPSLLHGNWDLDASGEDFAQFSYTLDEAAMQAIGRQGSLKIVKRYTLAKIPDDSVNAQESKSYHLTLHVEIQNLGKEQESVAYRLGGPTGLPLEGWWYSTKLHPWMFHGAGARDVVYKQMIGTQPGRHRLRGNPEIVSEAKKFIQKDEPPLLPLLEGDEAAGLEYIGVDAQFFAAAIEPQAVADGEPIKFRRAEALPVQDVMVIPKKRLRTTNVSVQLVSDVARIDPGKPLVHEYQVFFGPKDPEVLQLYDMEQWIELGWPIFAYPSRWLQGILNILYSLTHNYGIAIILLTVIVRSCMVPLSLRQAKSAAMMQQLAPEIQKIKDKYPDDAMKQHTEVQALYKQHNFNPFGGCLLVFIQLPIFIGLYRCLAVDIDLRDASLFPGWAWASNLAGPDKLFFWREWPFFSWDVISDEANGWFGPYFNVFPLITVTLFLIQQKLFTPPATDEQTKMQQQMMTMMTVFMGIAFYKVPAGLCLYFITSSLWGICERKLLPKPKPKGELATVELATAKLMSTKNGSAKPASTKKKSRR
jgi:YidC/Oxa1 family membrane protein insertase